MKITSQTLNLIGTQAQECNPFECCGILLSRHGSPDTIDDALRAKNAEKSHPEEAYILGHKAHIKAVELEISGKAHIAGYYHSHPHGGTKPSDRDTKQAVEGAIYLIINCDAEGTKYEAWRLDGKRFVEESVEVV